MELGIHLPRFDFPGGSPAIASELTRAAQAADLAGATWLSVMDHFFQIDLMAPADHAMLEGYTTLGFLAAHTSRTRLGLLVTGVTYRHPGVLAKIVATLDVLSGGRAALGIGAAGYEREHRGLGVPFPSTALRFEQLEEVLQICEQMWDPMRTGAFLGEHFRLDETLCVPAPLSTPRPWTLVGGSGERKTLRLVARYADACNLFQSAHTEVAHKLALLRHHCDDVGRDYETITVTMLYRGEAVDAHGIDAFTEEMRMYAEVGVHLVIVMPPGDQPAAWIDEHGPGLATRLADLGP